MNRQMFKWISDLVTSKPDDITFRPCSPLGLSVKNHYLCGHISNDRLKFTAQDKRTLRQQVINELGVDPLTTAQLPDDRIEMAKSHHNEKLAGKPVSHDHLLLTSPTGVIHVNGQNIQLHADLIPSAGLFCLNSGIASVEHEVIVVVENLAMMQLCATCQLPALAQQALWVYRGDHKTGAKVKTCHDFVRRFGVNKEVIAFSDMDPKGLEIALTIPFAMFWLGPAAESWQALLKSHHASRSGFDTQSEAMTYLLRLLDANSVSTPLTKLILSLRDERSSFRQEHTYNSNILLELFPIFPKI